MKIDIKNWSKEKKVFYGLAGTAILIGTTYAGLKIKDYVVSHRISKNKK